MTLLLYEHAGCRLLVSPFLHFPFSFPHSYFSATHLWAAALSALVKKYLFQLHTKVSILVSLHSQAPSFWQGVPTHESLGTRLPCDSMLCQYSGFPRKIILTTRKYMATISCFISQKSAIALLDLLERGHVLDYIEQHSRNEATKGSRGGPSRVTGVVTWATLFRSIVGYISKETEAIQKLEEKGSASSAIVQSNRVTKKKVNLAAGKGEKVHCTLYIRRMLLRF